MRYFFLLSCCLLLAGCTSEDQYSFIVAGHTYGNSAIEYTPGIHPAFKEKFEEVNALPNLEFAIFAGDIVQKSIPEQWDAIDKDLQQLKVKTHFVAGNHDIADRLLYEKRYGPTHYSFTRNKDLFIVMDTNIDNWSIKGEQLEWFKNLMEEKAADANHIFICTHHLVWTPGDDRFKDVVTNWPPLVPKTTNFWKEIYPILQNYQNQIVWIAGDLGANHLASPYSMFKMGNLHLVATGMGHGRPDNILLVEVNGKELKMTFRDIKKTDLPIIELK